MITLRDYAEKGDLEHEGGIILRPWMMNYEPEMGMKGVCEPAMSLDTNNEH